MSCRSFVALFLTVAAILPARAQQTPVTAQEFAYETVSIHPSQQTSGTSISPQGSHFTARGVTLLDLINSAYPIRPNSDVPGLPAWARSDTFDIDAAMSATTYDAYQKLPDPEQRAQRQPMLQKLLAAQFHLKLHSKTKTLPLYALVVAKGGPKLKPAAAGAQAGGATWENGQIKIQSGPLSKLAYCLSDSTGFEIVDKSGLTGTYAIELSWMASKDPSSFAVGSSLETALKEQLGLKLESGKKSIEIYFVDHAEKPAIQ